MRQSFRLVLALSLAFQPREAVAQAGALSGAVRLSEPVVTERGPHHRTWSRVTQITLPSGRVCYETNSYQELAGGMHYLNGQGVWTEARPLFELFPGGAIARQAQTQVILAPNANTAGAVDWRGPEGQRCRSHVLGITIIDRVSGESILIAELTDSIGELIAPAQILYRGALRGDGVVADLRYTVTRQGLEQDVIIRTWPVGASPVDWGLPPNGLYRLEVLSEFIEAPPPVRIQTTLRRENDEARRQAMAIPDLVDETLWWGSLMVGRGQAFPLGPQADETEREPVVKSFTQIQGRTFMIEGIEWAAVKAQVQALPATAALLPRRQDVQQARAPARDPKGEVQVARNMPPAPGVRPNDPAVRIPMASTPRPLDENKPGVSSQQKADVPSENSRVPASVHSGGAQSSILNSEKGFVLDYSTVVTANNMTLKGDTTFFVSGIITLSGTTLLESAVIKFTNGNTAAELKIQGPLDCRTDSHRPAIFAGKDDDSIGEIIPGSTGNPTTSYYGYYLDLAGNTNEIDLHDVRMRRGYYGIRMDSSSSLILRNAQISSNYTAVVNGKSRLRNVLIHDATYAYGGGGTNHHGEHVTFHRVAFLRSANLPSSYKTYLTNSLIISITSNVLYTGQNVISNLNDAGIFQTVGGGAHYLAAGSAHRNAGTTNIDTNLLAQLKQRTTYPPILLASSIESELTLSPQALRDTDLPDIGYHYDPLDYLVSGVTIAPGVTVQATGGVVLGLDYSQSSFGFILDSATFVSEGSPLALNRIVRAHVAQEQGAGNPGQRALFYDNTGSYGGPPPRWCQARFRFTEFSQLSADGYLLYIGRALSALEFTHSRVYNPSLVIDTSGDGTFVCGLTNTLWEGGGVQFGTTSTGSGVSVHLRNNLLRNVSWHFIAGNPTWTVKDNLFDTLPALDDHGSPVINSYNAYFSTTYNLSGGANNISLGSLVYEMGPLGRYYQPVTSALINAGSQSAAAAGLFHFTTTTDNAKEGTSQVDFGLHYVALNTSGLPIDSDGDGLPDYFEDSNGNGNYDVADLSNFYNPDSVGDGLSDDYELYKTLTNPNLADTGNTGTSDGYKDPDADGLTNLEEAQLGTPPLTPNVASLAFNPVGGNYPSAQNVAITCPTAGASIHYTVNGQTPTESDPAITSGSTVPVDHNLTLNAKAFRSGWLPSDTESESYQITTTPVNVPPTLTIAPPTGTTLLSSDDAEILIEAFDSDGTISKIQLFRGNFKIAESSASPLRYSLHNVVAGSYTFTAKAMDNSGAVTVSSTITLTITPSGPVVSLFGIRPFFTASPGTLVAHVEGVNPGALTSLTLNGAALLPTTGDFVLNPSLAEGENQFTLVATDNQNRTAQATTKVYLDSVLPTVSITAPANNSTFSTSRINVQGTFNEASLRRITVNGVLAFISGNSYEALNVPLDTGANAIIATAEDIAGNAGTASITVTGSANPVDPVQLQATPIGGLAPLNVTFQIQASALGTIQQVLYDFNGDNVTDQSSTDLSPITHTFTSAGQYFPVVTIQTTAGRFSSSGGFNVVWGQAPLRVCVQTPPIQQSSHSVEDPVDLEATSNGHLYVLSRSSATVREYDGNWSVIRSVAVGTMPTGLDVDSSGNVYVAVSGDNQVIRLRPTSASFELDPTFNGSGRIGRSDRAAGSGPGEFNAPFDVALSPDERAIYISDSNNHRIQQFDTFGKFLLDFGTYGNGFGQFNTPKGLTFGDSEILHIVDSGNSRLVLAYGEDVSDGHATSPLARRARWQ